MSVNDWKAVLNGVTVCGGDCATDPTVVACLTNPPTGTGAPALRTEDVTYPQRDGVEHFADWYEPRVLTFEGVIGNTVGSGCGCAGDARTNSRDLVRAWSRSCDDTELVLWTGCEHPPVENLVPNGSFDVNVDGWTGFVFFNITRTTSQFHSPPASLRYEATDGANSVQVLSDFFPITPGVGYTGSFFTRAATTGREFEYLFAWYDEDHNPLDSAVGASTTTADYEWREVTVDAFGLPANARYGRVGAILNVGGGLADDNEVHYFDDFTLYEVIEPDPVSGPFGVRGRPRVVDPVWRRGKKNVADVILRFDAIDHRLYILDGDGTPGSGAVGGQLGGLPEYPGDEYAAVVDGTAVDHHWPLDSLHTVGQVTEDVIGSSDATASGLIGTTFTGPLSAPTIRYNLAAKSVKGVTRVVTPTLWSGSYGNGLVGWWQTTDSEDATGATFSLNPTHVLDAGSGLTTTPGLIWGGSVNTLSTDVARGLGAPGILDVPYGEPVLVLVRWDASAVDVIVGYRVAGVFTVFTDTFSATGGLPAGVAATVTAYGGRVSNMIASAGDFADVASAQTLATTLGASTFDSIANFYVVPNIGDLCGPIQVTFTGNTVPPSVWTDTGNYVGTGITGGVVTVNTEDGSSLLAGVIDATPQITGDPFLQVGPGDTLYLYGGGAINISFRPSVLSA